MTGPDCVFCRIVAGKQAPRDYHDYGPVVRFEPLNPVTPGHRLFVPFIHVATVADDPSLAGLTAEFAASYAAGLYSDFYLIVNNGAAASQTVPHMHWHVVPRRPDDGLTLPWSGQQTGGTDRAPAPGPQTAPFPVELYPGCPCYRCDAPTWKVDPDWGTAFSQRMSLCPTCGNKRCPGAVDHDRPCSGSNKSGQPGSFYGPPMEEVSGGC